MLITVAIGAALSTRNAPPPLTGTGSVPDIAGLAPAPPVASRQTVRPATVPSGPVSFGSPSEPNLNETIGQSDPNHKRTGSDPLDELASFFASQPDLEGVRLLEILPLATAIRERYPEFAQRLRAVLRDPSAHTTLRLLTVELLAHHWDDPDVPPSFQEVFAAEPDSSWIRGRIALVLSEHDVDIGDALIASYAAIEGDVKSLSTNALARLRRTDAGTLIAEEAMAGSTDGSRLAAIDALGSLSTRSKSYLPLLEKTALTSGEVADESEVPIDFATEAVAIRAVTSIALSSDGHPSLLLELAANERLAVNVRIAAIYGLKRFAPLAPDEVVSLDRLSRRFVAGRTSDTSKSRFLVAIKSIGHNPSAIHW